MSDTEFQEELKQDLHDVLEAVEVMKEDQVSVDAVVEKMTPEIEEIIQRQVDEKVQAAEDARPYRKGEVIGPEGFEFRDQGIVEDGKFKGKRYSDLQATGALLHAMHSQQRKGENLVQLPSDEMTKILDPFVDGSGGDFTFTGLADELWRDIFLENMVINALGGPQSMPTDPWNDPLRGETVFRKATRGEAQSSQTPVTADSTFTTTKMLSETNWQYEMDEDSVIAVMPDLRSMLTRKANEAMDDFVINADGTTTSTGNINLNDSTPPTDALYLSDGQDGLRHYMLVDQTGQSANISTTLTDALLRTGLGKLLKYALPPADSPIFAEIKTFLISLMGLSNVVTLDKFGLGATVLTGQLASYQGHPVIVTPVIPLAGDDGKVVETGASNDEGQLVIPHRDMWRARFKRQLLIEVDRDIQRQVWIMVASFRIAIGARDRTSTHTAGVHGITFA